VLIFVFFTLTLLYFSGNYFLNSSDKEQPYEGGRGLPEGIIFTQVFTLFFTFLANPGEYSVGLNLDAKLVLILLISVNSLIFILAYFMHWSDYTGLKTKISLTLLGAVIVLVTVITRLWEEVWEVPLPFVAIICLWVILMFTVLDNNLNPKKFATGVTIGLIVMIVYLMQFLQYDREYLNIGYISLLMILSVVSLIFRRN
jgi:heme/copper-type cytochrome/quinol oxidase subunit 4